MSNTNYKLNNVSVKFIYFLFLLNMLTKIYFREALDFISVINYTNFFETAIS